MLGHIMEDTGTLRGEWRAWRKPWARCPPRTLCSDVWEAVSGAPAPSPWDPLWSPGPGPREASVLSHRWGDELQLEVLILEDAVESRATLGANEWPVALAAAVLSEFCKESQPGTSSVETAKLIKCLDLLWIQNRF